MRVVQLAAALAAALTLLGCDTTTKDRGPLRTNEPTKLTITVEEVGSAPRTATISCIGAVSGTGYLAGNEASGSACVTANISAPVVDVLRLDLDANEEAEQCREYERSWGALGRANTDPGGTASIEGIYEAKPISRRVDTAEGGCDEAVWGLLGPLLRPSKEPLIAKYADEDGV